MEKLSKKQIELIDKYWRAANYLSVGQIYLQDNPLLKEPLKPDHIKPRLLGHFGTVPGLNLIYVHLNRMIRYRDCDVIYVTGPGHGGPACRPLGGGRRRHEGLFGAVHAQALCMRPPGMAAISCSSAAGPMKKLDR